MIILGGINKHIIKINKSQYKLLSESLENEGGTWHNGNGYVRLSMDNSQDDKSNQNFDTRTHLSKRQALYGDGTWGLGARAKGLIYQRGVIIDKIKMLQGILKYAETKDKNVLYQPKFEALYKQFNNFVSTINGDTIYTSQNKKDKGVSQTIDDVIDGCHRQISISERLLDAIDAKYKRFMSLENDDDTAPAYYKGYVPQIREFDKKGGVIPGTGIHYIALFYMNDFNFSDAMKHGKVRTSSAMLQKANLGNETHPNPAYRIPAYYDDNNESPIISNNFSLNNNNEYDPSLAKDSVSQFISQKALPYAVEALKNENFKPNYILPAPSSSKYNLYFCTRLSQMTNTPMLTDFFQRNVSNVIINGEDCVERMRKDHITEKDITQFTAAINDIAYTEIFVETIKPLRGFLNKYWELFNNIKWSNDPKAKPFTFKMMSNFIITYSWELLLTQIENEQNKNNVVLYFIKLFKNKVAPTKGVNNKQIKYDFVNKILKQNGLFREYGAILKDVLSLMLKYSEQFQKQGWRIGGKYERFKITKCPESTRPYLKGSNIYVIASKYLVSGEANRLQEQMANSKFLIYDEDIDSGGTLMLLVDALRNVIPDCTDDQILCLVTATKHG